MSTASQSTIAETPQKLHASRIGARGLVACWSEEAEGNKRDRNVYCRTETSHDSSRPVHFRSRHITLSCSVAPIFGSRGELITSPGHRPQSIQPCPSIHISWHGHLSSSPRLPLRNDISESSFAATGSSRQLCPTQPEVQFCWLLTRGPKDHRRRPKCPCSTVTYPAQRGNRCEFLVFI